MKRLSEAQKRALEMMYDKPITYFEQGGLLMSSLPAGVTRKTLLSLGGKGYARFARDKQVTWQLTTAGRFAVLKLLQDKRR